MFESLKLQLASILLRKQLGGDVIETVVSMINGRQAPRRGDAALVAAFRVSPWFRAVVGKIAQKVGAVQWVLFAPTNSRGQAIRIRSLQGGDYDARHEQMAALKQQGRLMELDDHLLLDVLEEANPFMTGLTARKLTQTYLDIKGEAFWVLERNQVGGPQEYWPIPPNWVNDIATPNNPFYEVSHSGFIRKVPMEDMVYFRDPNPSDPYGRGIGIGESLGDEIETDEYASQYVKTFFLNRGKPDLLIAIEGAKKPALEKAKQEFQDAHQGWQRAHRTFWHGGKMQVKELQQKFTDMELSQLRAFERDTFISVYGVPPEIIGVLQHSNRATIKESRGIMATEVTIPRLEFLRSEMQMKMIPLFDDRLVLDYISPLPGDKDFRLEALKAAPHMATRGEWRVLQGLQDRGEADNIHMVPLNLLPDVAPPLPVGEVRALPAAAKAIGAEDIPGVLETLRPDRLTNQTIPLWQEQVGVVGDAALADLGLAISFDMLNPIVVAHLQEFATDRITGLVNETTREAIRAELVAGVEAGEGSAVIAKRVGNVFDAARGPRSLAIARTDVLRSFTFSSLTAYQQSGVVELKQWVSALTDESRDDHIDLDGEIVPLNQPFVTAGGDSAMAPGHFGIAGQDINCLCTLVPFIQEPTESDADYERRRAIWRTMEERRLKWERAAINALRKGFNDQEDDVLKALRAADRS